MFIRDTRGFSMLKHRQEKRYLKRYLIEFSAGGEQTKGISNDFSLGGLFLRTASPVSAGHIIDLRIHLPDRGFAYVKGKVIRLAKPGSHWYSDKKMTLPGERGGMGISIIERDKNYLHLIRSLLM